MENINYIIAYFTKNFMKSFDHLSNDLVQFNELIFRDKKTDNKYVCYTLESARKKIPKLKL